VARGQSIFRSAETGCASCHVEDTRFTDHETHTLAGAPGRTAPHFDTPSLAFVGQTAPYFHDGRFTTLEQLVDGCDEPATHMGHTKQLGPDDRKALVAYLRTL
jgi:cytochrome c peroxidase